MSMTPMRCCVIDDEPLAAQLIASYVKRTPGLELKGVYYSGAEAVKEIVGNEVDLLFLDIEMPQINGLEFAKVVPPACKIIFTTAYDQYAVQGYKVNAIDYLLKPVSYKEFLEAATKAMNSFGMQSFGQPRTSGASPKREFLLVKSEYKLVQIRISDIQVIEGLKDYIKIYVAGSPKAILTLMSMKAVEQALPSDMFMRVHRSYIVNTDRISIIERNHIIIADRVVPVSDSYRQVFTDYIASLNPEE